MITELPCLWACRVPRAGDTGWYDPQLVRPLGGEGGGEEALCSSRPILKPSLWVPLLLLLVHRVIVSGFDESSTAGFTRL